MASKNEKAAAADINHQKNLECVTSLLVPLIMLIYLGVTLKKYTLEGYSDLITNDFLLLGFKDIEAFRKHLVDNLIGSAVWGLSFFCIRKYANPESRATTWKNRQDVIFATVATFATGFLKAVSNNVATKL